MRISIHAFLTLSALVLLGCDRHEQFAADHALVSCELYEDCEVLELMSEYESLDACTESLGLQYGVEGDSCAGFENSSADDCLEGILLMTCDDLYKANWPAACEETCP